MSEIRLYVEGGRPGVEALMRNGFNVFLADLLTQARQKRMRWQVIVSGSRNRAYQNFCHALQDHPDAVNILLVDAEAPVETFGKPWQHLKKRDDWDNPGVGDDRCHLMVQTMEAWFVADPERLAHHFRKPANAVPDHPNTETVPKSAIEQIMSKVSQGEKNRRYDKIADGAKLLTEVRASVVRLKSAHCARLFQTISAVIDQEPFP